MVQVKHTVLKGQQAAQSTGSGRVHFDSRCNLAKPNPSADSDIHTGRSRLSVVDKIDEIWHTTLVVATFQPAPKTYWHQETRIGQDYSRLSVFLYDS